MKYWKKTIETTKDFTGTSPPSIFVGHTFYPRVYVGILSPPSQVENAEVLDSPEIWFKSKATINQIIEQRGQMVYSRFTSNVKSGKGKLVDVTRELSMAKKATDVEVELKKNPTFRMYTEQWSAPIGNPAPILSATLTENPRVERRVDYLVSDVDIRANRAISALYNYGLQVSRIQRIFSAGLLGVQFQRKFVPTRWGITAVDDILGKQLRERVKTYQEIGEIHVFESNYIGNYYFVLCLPSSYQFELVEIWHMQGKTVIGSDYEGYWGRKDYAEQTGGAFYSARLAAVEFLEKIRRQASILVVREIRSDYFAPVGIWQLRESVRDAFTKDPVKFNSIEEAVNYIKMRTATREKWLEKSKLLKNLKMQKRLTDF